MMLADPVIAALAEVPEGAFDAVFGQEVFLMLHIAAQADHFSKVTEDDEMSAETEKTLRRRQLKREVGCAVHLRERCARFIYGRDAEGFEAQMREEAKELADSQYGPELLQALGEMYLSRSELIAAQSRGVFSGAV
ncbi:hypothetical protein AK812_SmicGene34108 [Symbiodinium microadriaticum]|uniref:DNAJ-containing protein X-domain domain-containing protein n=1 Tax=Symbiodinium microadriaticum TaxID=2951 RepID=A0A1Q9CPW1_SYMMI|nr:hypothetical protein AK812_SmicGene34108 [Symbiodinium microadriaticum]